MTTYNAREESDVLIIGFDDAAGLNDFRNSALRDSLYELVQTRAKPFFAIDLLQVDYLSSSGLAILVGIKRRVETRLGKIVLFHVQPTVLDILKVTKLDGYFTLADDERSALASLFPASAV
jgi:anti-sigma B factor antagonist